MAIRPGLTETKNRASRQTQTVSQKKSSMGTGATPHQLNERFFFEITAPEDGIDRWSGSQFFEKTVKGAFATTMGIAGDIPGVADLDMFQSLSGQAADLINEAANSNGIRGLKFRGFLTNFPTLGVTNDYSKSSLFGGMMDALLSVPEAMSKFGAHTPNLAIDFQVPNMWKGTQPVRFDVEVQINHETLKIKATEPIVETAMASPGIHTMNAVMVALILASPRRFHGSEAQKAVVRDLVTVSPPVTDIRIGPMFMPNTLIENVNVAFGNRGEPPQFDSNGWPMDATLTFGLKSLMAYTQTSWDQLRTSITSTGIGAANAALNSSSFIVDVARGNKS